MGLKHVANTIARLFTEATDVKDDEAFKVVEYFLNDSLGKIIQEEEEEIPCVINQFRCGGNPSYIEIKVPKYNLDITIDYHSYLSCVQTFENGEKQEVFNLSRTMYDYTPMNEGTGIVITCNNKFADCKESKYVDINSDSDKNISVKATLDTETRKGSFSPLGVLRNGSYETFSYLKDGESFDMRDSVLTAINILTGSRFNVTIDKSQYEGLDYVSVLFDNLYEAHAKLDEINKKKSRTRSKEKPND